MITSKKNSKKIEAVKKLTEKIKKAGTIILVDYKGLKVAQDTELRKKMREAGIDYLVAKNRLFKIALKEAGIQDSFDDVLEGDTSFAFGYSDLIAPAKIVNDFSKGKDVFKIKAGLLEGKRIDATAVESLATLPSREELLAKMLGSLQAPISGLANVLQGSLRKFVYALDAVKKTKE